MFLIVPTQFGTGFQVPQIQCVAIVRGGSKTRGQTVKFDFVNADADVTDNDMDGGTNSGFANVIATTTASEAGGMFAVIEKAYTKTASPSSTVADDKEALVTMYGITQALIKKASGSLAKEDKLVIDVSVSATGLTSDADSAGVDHKVVAFALAALTTPTTETLARVFFFGGLPGGMVEA